MYCSKCGKQIQDNSVFCDRCGTRQTLQQQPLQSPKNTEGKWKAATFFALGAAIIAFCLFAYFNWFAQTPDSLSIWNHAPLFSEVVPGGSQLSLGNNGAQISETNAQSALQTEQANPLLGAWEGDIDGMYIALEFLPDGTARYFEDSDEYIYQYEIANNSITLLGGGVNLGALIFVLNDDILTVTIEEESISFSRVAELSPP